MSKLSKKILVVSPYFPYPTNFGGAVDILRRIVSLKESGSHITLVAIYNQMPLKEDIYKIEQYIDDLILIERKKGWKSITSFLPYQVSSRKELRKLVFTQEFDLLIIEGDYVANILENQTLKVKKSIMRMHNNESKYHYELWKSSFPSIASIHYLIESFKFRIYSRKAYGKVDKIACISKDECEYLKSYSYNAIFSPTIVNSNSMKSRDTQTKIVLYVGALFMPNNIEGLSWYIRNIHKNLTKYPDYKLIVVGSTHGITDEANILRLCNDVPSIEVFFNVPDLEYYYNQSSVFINPMLRGAGVKIKSINSIIEGLPLVSTDKGVEGTGLKHNEHVLIANNPLDFTKNIESLFEDKSLGITLTHNAQKYLKDNYSENSVIDYFLED